MLCLLSESEDEECVGVSLEHQIEVIPLEKDGNFSASHRTKKLEDERIDIP